MSTTATTFIQTYMQLHGGQSSHMVSMILTVVLQAIKQKGSTMY